MAKPTITCSDASMQENASIRKIVNYLENDVVHSHYAYHLAYTDNESHVIINSKIVKEDEYVKDNKPLLNTIYTDLIPTDQIPDLDIDVTLTRFIKSAIRKELLRDGSPLTDDISIIDAKCHLGIDVPNFANITLYSKKMGSEINVLLREHGRNKKEQYYSLEITYPFGQHTSNSYKHMTLFPLLSYTTKIHIPHYNGFNNNLELRQFLDYLQPTDISIHLRQYLIDEIEAVLSYPVCFITERCFKLVSEPQFKKLKEQFEAYLTDIKYRTKALPYAYVFDSEDGLFVDGYRLDADFNKRSQTRFYQGMLVLEEVLDEDVVLFTDLVFQHPMTYQEIDISQMVKQYFGAALTQYQMLVNGNCYSFTIADRYRGYTVICECSFDYSDYPQQYLVRYMYHHQRRAMHDQNKVWLTRIYADDVIKIEDIPGVQGDVDIHAKKQYAVLSILNRVNEYLDKQRQEINHILNQGA